VKPLDEQFLHDLAKLKMPLLTLEEAALQGGFGSAVLEFLHDQGYHNVEVKRLGIPDQFIEHGSVSELLEEIGLTSANVFDQLVTMLPKKRQRA
jgi:1-deoxy-D-xylulose-5-phosphate synthase